MSAVSTCMYTVHCTLYSSFKYIVPSYADADYGLCLQYLLAAKVDWSKIINKQVSYNMVQRDQKNLEYEDSTDI